MEQETRNFPTLFLKDVKYVWKYLKYRFESRLVADPDVDDTALDLCKLKVLNNEQSTNWSTEFQRTAKLCMMPEFRLKCHLLSTGKSAAKIIVLPKRFN